MRFDQLIEQLSSALSNMGNIAAKYPFEPLYLGDVFPALSVQYRDDDNLLGGSDEVGLPARVSFRCRIYYPIRQLDDGRDGLLVAQQEALKGNGLFREAVWNNPSLGGLVMRAETEAGRAFGITDEAQGDLYCHEIDVVVNVH